jgi:hypothetical protein
MHDQRRRHSYRNQFLVSLLSAALLSGVLCPVHALAYSSVGGLAWGQEPAPGSAGAGSTVWTGGGSTVPGAPSAGAGCAPQVNVALGQAAAAGYQNRVNIASQNLKSPTKILTGCLTGVIKLLDALSVFSKAGSLGFDAILDQVEDAALQYGATEVCQVVATEFNGLMNQAFNAVAFLKDVVPCGIGINLPSLSAGAGPGLCAIVGGPLVNIGVQGGSVYTMPNSTYPTLLSGH